MKFVIRDDDACGFTSPEQIRACYERVWPEVPVSLSVTPFRIPANDWNAPEHVRGSMTPLPLDGNDEMVQFLREGTKHGQLDITLHGYHHLLYDGLPEFIGGDELAEKARTGKAYLESLLDVKIHTFVPPHNGIGQEGLVAVASAGMNLAGMPVLWSPRGRHVTLRSLSQTPRVVWHQKFRGRRYPFTLDLGDHQEISCHTAGPRSYFGKLRDELRYCHKVGGVFVLATHYHAFERKTQDGHAIGKVIYDLVDMAAGFPGAEFVAFNSIWQ